MPLVWISTQIKTPLVFLWLIAYNDNSDHGPVIRNETWVTLEGSAAKANTPQRDQSYISQWDTVRRNEWLMTCELIIDKKNQMYIYVASLWTAATDYIYIVSLDKKWSTIVTYNTHIIPESEYFGGVVYLPWQMSLPLRQKLIHWHHHILDCKHF
jgi:hypothetical protein